MATFAPSEARRLAIAAPIPRDPPVISAIFPSSFLFMILFSSMRFGDALCIDEYKINAGQMRVKCLFTYWYETQKCTTRTAARVRSGRCPGTRDARFLGQRLRRRFALRPHTDHAHQPAKSLRRIWQQAAALSKGSRSIHGRTGRLF